MTTDDPLIDTLTRALEAHQFADADTCACGVEYGGQMTYERHQAEVYLAAIAATGRLLPDGGKLSEDLSRDGRQRRTIYIGAWEAVPCTHGASWAPKPVDGVRTWHCRHCPETWTEAVDDHA